MNRPDPFIGYALLLRTLIFVVVPAFGVWQFVRLRRALHVFQLEGYKRRRFLRWCRANRYRTLWMKPLPQKKPLVMTGRAWRLLVTGTLLAVLAVVGTAGIAHVNFGTPYDLITFAVVMGSSFFFTSEVLVLSDALLAPVQRTINGIFLRRARETLRKVAPMVVGVTGSFGKTSTKFAVQHLAGVAGRSLATPGSFNNPLGVSRTINEELGEEHDLFVVEMGAYSRGEIAELCRMVHPRIGVLTAIGPAHLERFGSMDAIRAAKYELIESLPREGVAVMNVDDPEVRALADKTSHVRVVRYGIDPAGGPDVTAREVSTDRTGMSFVVRDAEGNQAEMSTRLLGKHAVGHVLAGIAVARELGRPLDQLTPLVAAMQPVEHRLQIIQGSGGVTVIDDAYNSNPEGAAAAFEVLSQMPGGKKVVVTPGVIELGPLQEAANRALGAGAARVADALIVVARTNRDAIVEGARGAGTDVRVIATDTLAQATEELKGLLAPGDVVLFENDLPDQYEG